MPILSLDDGDFQEITDEELVSVEDKNHTKRDSWVEADYPWQDGETVEECLRAALVWVAGG